MRFGVMIEKERESKPDRNSDHSMEAVFADIQRARHPLMPDYAVFSADEHGMYVEYFSPSKEPLFSEQHARSSEYSTQLFLVDSYSSYTSLIECYSRMIRCGKPDYLSYYWLSHEDPLLRENVQWICDICSKRVCKPETTTIVPASYMCMLCEDMAVCAECYINEISCRRCNRELILDTGDI